MSLELLLILGAVCFAANWYWQRRNNRPLPPSPTHEQQPALHGVAPVADQAEVTDPFLEQITKTRAQVTTLSAEEIKAHKRALDDKYGEDVKVKEELSKFAIVNELDKALIALADEIKSYPLRAKREDFDKWNTLNIRNISGSNAEGTNTVNFDYGEGSFCTTERGHDDFEGDRYTDFSFYENGEEMFAITCSSEYLEYGMRHQCVSVDAFKRRGSWANTLLSLHARIEVERHKLIANSAYFRAEDIKQKFEK